MKSNSQKTYLISCIGVLSAMVFATNFLSIPIGEIARLHMGNVMCILAGVVLGGVPGGLCAGLGGFFYDLTNPLYASEALITFGTKFFLGFFAGVIAHSYKSKGENFGKNLIGGIVGSVAYIILYLGKNFIIDYYLVKNPLETVLTKISIRAASSTVNAIVAVVIATILAPVFIKAMKQSGIYQKLHLD